MPSAVTLNPLPDDAFLNEAVSGVGADRPLVVRHDRQAEPVQVELVESEVQQQADRFGAEAPAALVARADADGQPCRPANPFNVLQDGEPDDVG